MVDIIVADTSLYVRHTDENRDMLSKIAKYYYEDAMKYNTIFEANTDQLKSADVIHPGQELVIPKL